MSTKRVVINTFRRNELNQIGDNFGNGDGKIAARVLLLCPDFGYGGAERSFAKVAALLSRHFEVTCVAFNNNIDQVYEIKCKVELLDGRALRFSISRFLARVWRMRSLVKRHNADVSLSFLEGADYVNFFSGAHRRLASIRGSKTTDTEIVGLKGLLRRAMMRFIYPRMDGVIPASHGLGKEMTSVFGVPAAKVFPIMNFYDLDEIKQEASASLPESIASAFAMNQVWCHVGRLHPQKNQEFLIRLLKKSRPTHPRSRLALVGDGPQSEALKDLCDQLGLSFSVCQGNEIDSDADVWFMGYQRNPHVFLAKSELFLFPSLHEGFPNALVEAMACGVPVIAADCIAGPAEILDVERVQGQTMVMGRGGILVKMPDSNDSFHFDNWMAAIDVALAAKDSLTAEALDRVRVFSELEAETYWNAAITGTSTVTTKNGAL